MIKVIISSARPVKPWRLTKGQQVRRASQGYKAKQRRVRAKIKAHFEIGSHPFTDPVPYGPAIFGRNVPRQPYPVPEYTRGGPPVSIPETGPELIGRPGRFNDVWYGPLLTEINSRRPR